LTCLLLMAGLPITNWIRFFVWLLIGLCFYHFYGRRHSQLSDANIKADADRDKDKLR
jgi:APA family basic amino acid/polyamine antiporter